MKKVNLIQRLRKPDGFKHPFSPGGHPFGVGLKDGGIPEKVMEVLKGIFEFDYMGACEFEWGAVPNTLAKILLYCHEGKISTGKIILKKEVNYLCKIGIEKHVDKIIRQLSVDESKFELERACCLRDNILGTKYAQVYGGWLELNNGFMFFVDNEMYKNVLDAFGIIEKYLPNGINKLL